MNETLSAVVIFAAGYVTGHSVAYLVQSVRYIAAKVADEPKAIERHQVRG